MNSIHALFQENSTIIEPTFGGEQIQWYAERNRVCKDLGLDKAHRDSVPLNLPINQIKSFLEASKTSEPWNTMKLVVLGHGRIGKTTLVSWKNMYVYSFYLQSCYQADHVVLGWEDYI